MFHLEETLKLGSELRLASGNTETSDEVEQRVQLQKKLLGLKLRRGDRDGATQTLKSLAADLPLGKELSTLRQQVLLEVAGIYERELGDRTAALMVLDRLLGEQPLQIPALERVVQLSQASGETARAQSALTRARDEARCV